MRRRYVKNYHLEARRARFIPIKDGDVVELGNTGLPGIAGTHTIIGFKPGPGPRAEGWLVVLVNEAASVHSRPHKRRALRAVS